MLGAHRIFLSGLRLRRAVCRLRQRANDAATRQIDLEVVVPEALCVAQQQIGRAARSFPRSAACPRSAASASGSRHGLCATPPSARRASLMRAAFELERRRNRDERERIGQPVADLEIGIIRWRSPSPEARSP